MPNCNFIEITFQHGCFLVNLLHFSEYLFIGTPLEGCFSQKTVKDSSVAQNSLITIRKTLISTTS